MKIFEIKVNSFEKILVKNLQKCSFSRIYNSTKSYLALALKKIDPFLQIILSQLF